MFAPNTKILILDDMGTIRSMVSKILKELGFSDITQAADGNIGWDFLQKAHTPFQLIVSDWNMPNCTGIELLKRVRSDAKYGTTPFILLTAEAEVAQIKEALSLGVNNYILKPFTPNTLKEKLEQTHQKILQAGQKAA